MPMLTLRHVRKQYSLFIKKKLKSFQTLRCLATGLFGPLRNIGGKIWEIRFGAFEQH